MAFQIVMSEREIRAGVAALANQLKLKPYTPEVVVPIMDGALLFAADIMRSIYPELDPAVAPMKLTRVARLTDHTRFHVLKQNIQFHNLAGGLKSKNVVILDTISDSGETLRAAINVVKEGLPRNVTTVCLIWKGNESIAKPDLYAHKLDEAQSKEFLMGYGLDKEGKRRGAPFIYF